MLKPELKVIWEDLTGPVDAFMTRVTGFLTQRSVAYDEKIQEHVNSALKTRGKGLRAALYGWQSIALDGRLDQKAIKAASIVELVHLATLVHDDVIDVASIRRNRPTLRSQYDNHVAVLSGDCLFADALELAAEYSTTFVCREVAKASKAVCSGEIIQSDKRFDLSLSKEDYLGILGMKTGELFRLSCLLACHLAEASDEVTENSCRFGMLLGTAYQVFDDCVDYYSEESAEGKSLGTDFASGKITLPLILANEFSIARSGKILTSAAGRKVDREDFESRKDHLLEIANEQNCREECLIFIQDLLDQAKRALWAAVGPDRSEHLATFVDFFARQVDGLRVDA